MKNCVKKINILSQITLSKHFTVIKRTIFDSSKISTTTQEVPTIRQGTILNG